MIQEFFNRLSLKLRKFLIAKISALNKGCHGAEIKIQFRILDSGKTSEENSGIVLEIIIEVLHIPVCFVSAGTFCNINLSDTLGVHHPVGFLNNINAKVI